MVSDNPDNMLINSPKVDSGEKAEDIDFFDYTHVKKASPLHFYNVPWWVYYLGAWLLVILSASGIFIYTLVTPPKLPLIIINRIHQLTPIRGLFYPSDFERKKQTEKNVFFQQIQKYEHDHLVPENLEITPQGLKPVLSASRTPPWKRYAGSPGQGRGKPLVIIIRNLGLSEKNTQAAFKLPAQTVFDFSPYASNLNQWVSSARSKGHEVLITMPVEPKDITSADAGVLQLSPNKIISENLGQFNTILGKTTGYIGLISSNDSNILRADDRLLLTIMQDMSRRGIIFIDNRLSGPQTTGLRNQARGLGLPYHSVDWSLVNNFNEKDIRQRLNRLDRLVRSQRRTVIAQIAAHPLTFIILDEWIKNNSLNQKIKLVPLTSTL